MCLILKNVPINAVEMIYNSEIKSKKNLQMKEYIHLLKFDLTTSLDLENLENLQNSIFLAHDFLIFNKLFSYLITIILFSGSPYSFSISNPR